MERFSHFLLPGGGTGAVLDTEGACNVLLSLVLVLAVSASRGVGVAMIDHTTFYYCWGGSWRFRTCNAPLIRVNVPNWTGITFQIKVRYSTQH